jgi:MFS family permease
MRRRIGLVVCAIVLLDSLFFAALTPMLPYYADRFDLSGPAIGVLSGAYAAGTLIGSIPSGWLAARIGSHRTVVIGLLLMTVASLVFAFGGTSAALVAARFVQGLAGACSWVGAMGWLLSVTPVGQRGRAIGQVTGLGFAGGLMGPAFGALAREVGAKAPFSAIAVLGLVLLAVVHWTPPPPLQQRGDESLGAAIRVPAVRAGMALMFLPAFVAGCLNVLSPLRLDAIGAGGFVIGATFLIAGGVQAVGQVAIGRLIDRVGQGLPILIALLVGAGLLLTLPLPSSVPVLAALVVCSLTSFGVIYTPATALLADGSAAAGLERALAFALVNLTWAGGQTVGALSAGGLADTASKWVPSVLLATLGAVAAFALWRRRHVTFAQAIRE